MKTVTAKYKGEIIYIHYVSVYLEYVLISREPEPVRQFKVNYEDLTGITEEELRKMVRDRIIEEQFKKGAP
jgi:hypothetical protein